ncbi:hypothetical protein K7711_36530 [Nocardia sp. CA2R105]|uniref:hypothetical protein n=1 Tax=Nocardia coffeae TaxID=2873381 RepID=UPI001CA6B440|nr:hypothetical protein [Nocardia coffeae]MBY8862031.1 hypothetical protein [Nocardia coffeae]
MQTAAMTMNLLQRRGAESRSVAEHQTRQAVQVLEQQRKDTIHDLQQQGYGDRASQAAELHDVEVQIKQGRLTNDQTEATRRTQLHGFRVQSFRAERNRQDAIHERQIGGYDARAAHARHLHSLEVEYKKLLIESRRRALGFTETLSEYDRDTSSAAISMAAWAGAHSTADLSAEHSLFVEAYDERFAQDTGDLPSTIIDATADDGLDESVWPSEVFESMAGLASEFVRAMVGDQYLHEALDSNAQETPADPQPGEVIDAIWPPGTEPVLGELPLDVPAPTAGTGPETGPEP